MKQRLDFCVHHAIHWPQRWDRRLWKADGSEALPHSRLPGNCCYATIETPPPSLQSKCSVLLAEAELRHDVPSTCEGRCFQIIRRAGKQRHACWHFRFVQLRFPPGEERDDASHSSRPVLLMLQSSRGRPDALRSQEMNKHNYIDHERHTRR